MRLAVLIDAENAQPSALDRVMQDISRRGTPVTRRAYGNFQDGKLAAWIGPLQVHAFRRVALSACCAGKNAADIALAIDAMDLLHQGGHEGFCIVSSDSDFAPLGRRLREGACKVFGFGAAKSPNAWRRECTAFIDTAPASSPADDPLLQSRILKLVHAIAVDGMAALSAVGQEFKKATPPIPGKTSKLIGRIPGLTLGMHGKTPVVRLPLAAE